WEGSGDPLPLVLSSEATRSLLDVVHRFAFSALSYSSGVSFLRENLGVQVFDRAFALRDDGTDTEGLPFPFDLEGTPKQRIELVSEGTPRTPVLDQRQAAALGLPPTGHAVGGNDALAQNLFLLPGAKSEDDLLAAADGGLWVGDISPVECFEPQRLAVRAALRGVRRIRDGKRAEPLHDVLWQGSLLRAGANLLGIGDRPQVGWLHDRGIFGGCSCPPLAFAAVQGLSPLPVS
ncbi:MAG: metallopeptidase TldD-related protein, partial [Thermoanaerobaculia bacterium]